MSLCIETVDAENFEQVLPLIAGYQEFYQRIPDEAANRKHFSQFLGGQHPLGIQFLAISADGRPLGFATLYFLPSSLSARTSCVLNDLFTSAEARKQGVGEALVRHCLEHAGLRGYASLDWQTAPSNTVAQSLYDRLGAKRVSWYHYSLATSG